VAIGYYKNPEANARSFTSDGWFATGDIGIFDGNGYLKIVDRKKELIIRGGANIYPREIEEVLYQHPAVVDCAVFGIPDERDGEHVKAVVELRPEARATTAAGDLEAFCKQHLATYKVPQAWDLVDELPRDPNGKVLKRLLRDAAWQGQEKAV